MKHRQPRKPGYQPSLLLAAVVLLLLVFVSVGYFFFLSNPALTVEQQRVLTQLQQRREEWLAKRPPAYRYEIERECECPLQYIEPFTVIEYLDEADRQAWIDDYFMQLEAALREHQDVAISYDPRFSYPNDFHIDAEQVYIRDFEVLQYE